MENQKLNNEDLWTFALCYTVAQLVLTLSSPFLWHFDKLLFDQAYDMIWVMYCCVCGWGLFTWIMSFILDLVTPKHLKS